MSTELINAAAPTALILLIMLLRKCLGGKIPRKVFYILWTAAALRLVLPVSADWALLRLPLLPPERGGVQRTVTEGMPEVSGVTEFSEPLSGLGEIFTAVYIGGVILLALYFCTAHIKTLRSCKFSLPFDVDISGLKSALGLRRGAAVRICENACSPFTCGIFRHVIILPREAEKTCGENLRHILGHELVHIKRLDVLRNVLFAAALCINWINPVVWVMYEIARRDMEITCDEEAVERFSFSPKEYAMTLISMEERLPRSFSAAFGKKPVRERIERIVSNPPSMGAAAGFAVVVVSSFFFTAAERMPYSENVYEGAENTAVEEYAVYTDYDGGNAYAEPQALADYAAASEIAVAAAEVNDTILTLKDVTLDDAFIFFGIDIYDAAEGNDGKIIITGAGRETIFWESVSAYYTGLDTVLTEVGSDLSEYEYTYVTAAYDAADDVYYADEYTIAARAE